MTETRLLEAEVSTLKKAVHSHDKALFGDSNNQYNGIMHRVAKIEDRLQLFWGALGAFGGALILFIVNMFVRVFGK